MSLDGQLPRITDAKGLVIDGSPTPITPASAGFRAFWVDPGAKLTLTNISLNNFSLSGNGAAVLNTGWLKVIGSDLSNNASTAPGGFGGAINNTGRLEVTSSSFYGNSSNEDGSAIASASAAYTARISKSTFANNTGGVSAVYHGSGKMEVTTSTFTNNVRIGITDHSGDLTVISSTFFRNTYSNFGHSSPYGEVAILSTILGKNPDSPGGNCAGDTLIDGGYNVSDDDPCGFSVAHHSLSNTDPLLDPLGLQDNGGPTQTIALQPTSPAIDNVEIYGAVYPPGSNYTITVAGTVIAKTSAARRSPRAQRATQAPSKRRLTSPLPRCRPSPRPARASSSTPAPSPSRAPLK